MTELREFRLPDLGEGLTEGEILGWLVAEGDMVTLNQPIVEVETAKAAVEVPSPYAGRVVKLHHGAGETVDVGSTIITVDTASGLPGADEMAPESPGADGMAPDSPGADGMAPDSPGADGMAPGSPGAGSGADAPRALAVPQVPNASPDDLVPTLPDTLDPDAAPAAGLIGGTAPGGRTAVLVGYGPKSTVAVRRPRKAVADGAPATVPGPAVRVLAKPPVRKLARDLGVDLSTLAGSGADGVVTRSDVHAARATAPQANPSSERRIPVKGVRKLTAANMVASAFSAPHVTEFLTCDVTPTMDLVGRVKALPEFAATRVTPLLLVAKALLVACRRHPEVNASWDEAAQEIVVHGAVNLGIAAATPRGLLVPNVKDAGSLSLSALAEALTTLTTVAREGRTPPADMAGGTITITNVGAFGVDTGTPILNPGEAAILCLGAIRDTPWVVDGQVAVRKVTILGLSFDHRMVDGQLGSQFLADIAAMLSDPACLLAWS